VNEVKLKLAGLADEMRTVLHSTTLSPAEIDERYDRLNADALVLEKELSKTARLERAKALEAANARSAPAPTQVTEQRASTATPEYKAAFFRYLHSGNPAEVRAITGSTSNIGLPDDMYRTLVERLYAPTNFLGRVQRLSIDGDKKFAIGNALPTSAFVDENSSITASDPSFSTQVTVDPKKIVCRTTASIEALADAVGNPDMQGYIMRQQADSMRILLEKAIIQGGVTNAWTDGLEKAPVTASQTQAGGAQYANLTGDNIIDCVHKVAPQYRTGNFFWLMNDDALKAIRKIKSPTTTSTEYLWKVGTAEDLTSGMPGTIYGVPYMLCQSCDSTETTNARIIVGNHDYCTLFERLGMQMLVDPYSGASSLAVNLYTYARYDFKVLLPEAFAGITFTTSG
jgi:HK97 family phage major capsid protein